MCLSAFAIARRGDSYLVVKPKDHPLWATWAPNWDIYDAAQRATQFALWRLPAAYLAEGEGPDDTVKRIVQDQLGAQRCFVKNQRVLNFHDPSARFPGQKHWDLCFVYDLELEPAPLAKMPWLADLRWVKGTELTTGDFGSAIGDLALALGLLGGAVRTGSPPPRNL